MVVHKCERCLKEFKRKDYYTKHLQRKYPCKPATENLHQFTSNSINLHQFTSPNINNKNKEDNNIGCELNNNKIKCKYCNFEVIKNNLSRHQRTTCEKIPNYKKKILIDKYNNHKSTKKQLVIHNNTNNNINNNNSINNSNNTVNNIKQINNIQNNNITLKINPFGKEDISFLTTEDKMNLLMKRYMGVPELIKMIHDIPSNHNIYQPNINKKTLAVLNDNNELEFNDYKNICEKLIEDNIQRLDDFFNELEEDINSTIKNRLKRVIEDNNNGSLNDKYIEDIKYHIINISKRNKKELNEYLDMVEKELNVKSISN